MKGVILAGGKGTRLQPATFVTNKHLLPILNRPMIEYPIDTLLAFGIKDILIVSGGDHIGAFAEYLGDGSKFGVSLTYKVQQEAGGIAEALGLAKDFAAGEAIVTILGDNVFDNTDFSPLTPAGYELASLNSLILFTKKVSDPERFGVLAAINGRACIIEKPQKNVGSMAVTGLYIYPSDVFDIIPNLVRSRRGELEITDVNNWYIKQNRMISNQLITFWSDAGTPDSLYEVIKWVKSK